MGKRGGGFDEDEEYLESLSKQLQAQKLGTIMALHVSYSLPWRDCYRCCGAAASVATTVKSEADVIAIAKQSAIRADVTRINTM